MNSHRLSPVGPGIKIVAYLALALGLGGVAISALGGAWGIFVFCTLVSACAVQAVARVWASERAAAGKLPLKTGEWNQLLADLGETENRVPQ